MLCVVEAFWNDMIFAGGWTGDCSSSWFPRHLGQKGAQSGVSVTTCSPNLRRRWRFEWIRTKNESFLGSSLHCFGFDRQGQRPLTSLRILIKISCILSQQECVSISHWFKRSWTIEKALENEHRHGLVGKLFRCASISWFQIVSQWVSNWYFLCK